MLQTDLQPFDALAFKWLSADFRSRMIIDPLARVHWWNDAAKRAVGASRAVSEVDGFLMFSPDLSREFSAYLTGLRSSAEGEIFTVKDGDGHLLMLGHHEAESDMFCLEISCSHVEEPIMFADFRSIFGLTEGERQTALALFHGKMVAEIAQDRNVSVDTVRTQVRKVYSKIGAQSREKFFKILMTFRIG